MKDSRVWLGGHTMGPGNPCVKSASDAGTSASFLWSLPSTLHLLSLSSADSSSSQISVNATTLRHQLWTEMPAWLLPHICEPRGLSRNINPACSSLIRSSLFQCRQPDLNFSSNPCFFACLELPMNSPATGLDSSHLWLWMGLEGVGGQRVAKFQIQAIDTGWVETAEWGVTWVWSLQVSVFSVASFHDRLPVCGDSLCFPREHKNITFFHPNHLKQKWRKP